MEEQTCIWKQDEFSGEWVSECGGLWELIEGTPKDNRMNFCPYCGRKILEVIQKCYAGED